MEDESEFDVLDATFVDNGFSFSREIRSFLAQYPSFIWVPDDLPVDSSQFYRSAVWPEYIVLGSSPNGFYLLNREGEKMVVEAEKDDPELDLSRSAYPTIYHWILARYHRQE